MLSRRFRRPAERSHEVASRPGIPVRLGHLMYGLSYSGVQSAPVVSADDVPVEQRTLGVDLVQFALERLQQELLVRPRSERTAEQFEHSLTAFGLSFPVQRSLDQRKRRANALPAHVLRLPEGLMQQRDRFRDPRQLLLPERLGLLGAVQIAEPAQPQHARPGRPGFGSPCEGVVLAQDIEADRVLDGELDRRGAGGSAVPHRFC